MSLRSWNRNLLCSGFIIMLSLLKSFKLQVALLLGDFFLPSYLSEAFNEKMNSLLGANKTL